MSGEEPIKTCGHDVHKKSRDSIGEEYGMTGRNIARYMRVNQLVEPLKEMLDQGEISLVAAVDLSYLEEKEQEMVLDQAKWGSVKSSPKTAKKLRENSNALEDGNITAALNPITDRGKTAKERSEVVVFQHNL